MALLTKLWAFAPIRYLLLIAAAGAMGVAVGRYLTPPKVITKTETKTEVVTKEVVRIVKIASKDKKTKTTVTPTPNGPVTVTETEEHTDSKTNTNETGNTTSVSDTTSTKIVERPKSWLIAPMVGVGGLGQGAPTPALGAEFSGRVWGPVRVGGWGLYFPAAKPSGAAGVSVGVEF